MESVGDHHDKSCTSPDFRSIVHQAQEVFPGRRVLVIICTFFDVGLMTLFSTYFRVVSFVALDLLLFIEFAWGFRWYLIRRSLLSDNLEYPWIPDILRTMTVEYSGPE